MPAAENLCRLIGIQTEKLTKEENIIIEAELFARVCEKLREAFLNRYSSYFRLIKSNRETEIVMLEESFARCIINDILSTEEYNLTGIASYTRTPEEIVIAIASGNITNPTMTFFRNIIELHRSVRKDLYKAIMQKILSEYSVVS